MKIVYALYLAMDDDDPHEPAHPVVSRAAAISVTDVLLQEGIVSPVSEGKNLEILTGLTFPTDLVKTGMPLPLVRQIR